MSIHRNSQPPIVGSALRPASLLRAVAPTLTLSICLLCAACSSDAASDAADAQVTSCGSGFFVELDGVAPTEIVIDEADLQLRLDRRMFAVEFWAKLEVGGRVSVQKRGEAVGGSETDAGWEVSMTTDQIVVAVHGESTQRAINIADRPVQPGWHHLAFSWDRGQSLAFLDGALVQPTDCGVNGDLDDGEVCLYTVSNPIQPPPHFASARSLIRAGRSNIRGWQLTSFESQTPRAT